MVFVEYTSDRASKTRAKTSDLYIRIKKYNVEIKQ